MSGVHSSAQPNDPGTSASPNPGWSLGCHALIAAPVGSAITVMRPDSSTSNGGASTMPPAASAALAVWSASSVAT
ncbi:MAG: hypothetical protein M3Q23_09730 [Actinomycetota bacterium]|nr:hypothetical protein [Actinomycetota bacterium]